MAEGLVMVFEVKGGRGLLFFNGVGRFSKEIGREL